MGITYFSPLIHVHSVCNNSTWVRTSHRELVEGEASSPNHIRRFRGAVSRYPRDLGPTLHYRCGPMITPAFDVASLLRTRYIVECINIYKYAYRAVKPWRAWGPTYIFTHVHHCSSTKYPVHDVYSILCFILTRLQSTEYSVLHTPCSEQVYSMLEAQTIMRPRSNVSPGLIYSLKNRALRLGFRSSAIYRGLGIMYHVTLLRIHSYIGQRKQHLRMVTPSHWQALESDSSARYSPAQPWSEPNHNCHTSYPL